MNRVISSVFRAVGQKMTQRATVAVYNPHVVGTRSYSHRKEETEEEFDERYIRAFSRPDLDDWWLRKAMGDLHFEDAMPEPKLIIAGLRACRRLNDYALAVRFLESMKLKCAERVKEVWPYVLQEIKPTLDELGINTPEEMGYEKPELFIPDEDFWLKEYYDTYNIKKWN